MKHLRHFYVPEVGDGGRGGACVLVCLVTTLTLVEILTYARL